MLKGRFRKTLRRKRVKKRSTRIRQGERKRQWTPNGLCGSWADLCTVDKRGCPGFKHIFPA